MGDVLDRVEVFADLAAGERDELRALARPFQLGAGDLLFRQGEPANGLFLVGEGMLEIASRTPGDDAATVSQIAPGEVVGEFALLDAGPRSANVRAVEDSAGLMLPARGFAALLADNGPGALAAIDRLRRLVATRTRATLERLAASSQAEPSELRPGPTPATPAPAAPTPIMLRSINPRFATLGDDDCRELFAAAEAFAVPRGAGLLATGDGSASALFVLRGAARASIERGGQREQVALHGPGEWLGLVAMSDGGVQPLAADASEDSVLLRVERAVFDRWRTAPSRLGQLLMEDAGRQLVRDQRRANRHLGRVLALARFNAAEREIAAGVV